MKITSPGGLESRFLALRIIYGLHFTKYLRTLHPFYIKLIKKIKYNFSRWTATNQCIGACPQYSYCKQGICVCNHAADGRYQFCCTFMYATLQTESIDFTASLQTVCINLMTDMRRRANNWDPGILDPEEHFSKYLIWGSFKVISHINYQLSLISVHLPSIYNKLACFPLLYQS